MRRPKFGLVCFVLAVSAAMGTVVGSAPPAGAATIVPVLSAPVTSNTYTSPSVSIAYTLPQAPLAGSVRLVFLGLGLLCLGSGLFVAARRRSR